jgi:membrane protein
MRCCTDGCPTSASGCTRCFPAPFVGAALWVAAAATLSYTLRSAGKLALVYGSFAGVVATLVFLYVSATTLIYGAEVNAVLRGKASDRR